MELGIGNWATEASLSMPLGVADILLGDAVRIARAESSLRGLFENWGYGEVIPPILETYETLLEGGTRPDWLYRFTDQTGDVLALRPDLTTQVARIVATRLREQPKPLRLFYVGSVFRQGNPAKKRRSEFTQAGIELVGSCEAAADAEVVALAIEALRRLGVDDFQINLGHSQFFRGLVEEMPLPNSQIAFIQGLLDRKDKHGLQRELDRLKILREQAHLILGCLTLCGREEVLDDASMLANNERSRCAVENLSEIYRILQDCRVADRVVIDLTEVRGLGYYTGVMIEGFSRSLSATVLEGGRYDDLVGSFGYPCPAVGCALDVGRLSEILGQQRDTAPPAAEVLLRFDPTLRREAYVTAARLRAEGRRTEFEVATRSEEEAIVYAKQRGIRKLITIGTGGTRELEIPACSQDGEPWSA